MTGICSCWRRRCSACATRRRRFIATPKPSATRRRSNWAKAARSRGSKAWAKFRPPNSSNSSATNMRLSQVEYAPKPDAAEHPRLLHGQEHARAQGLHHGKSGRAGGGLSFKIMMAAKRKNTPAQPEIADRRRRRTKPSRQRPKPPRTATATAKAMSWPRKFRAVAHRPFAPGKIEQALHRRVNTSFLEYASYVIRDRAIPNLADGLKPVQRRILWALHEKDDGRFIKVANDRRATRCSIIRTATRRSATRWWCWPTSVT